MQVSRRRAGYEENSVPQHQLVHTYTLTHFQKPQSPRSAPPKLALLLGAIGCVQPEMNASCMAAIKGM